MRHALLALGAALAFAPGLAWAVPAGDFDISPATGWAYGTSLLIISAPGAYTIKMNGVSSTATNTIFVDGAGGTFDITLDNVSIDQSAGANPGFNIAPGSSITVNLTLVGANTLKGGTSSPGLDVATGATLKIDGAGSLTAFGGGNGGAGIGGYYDQDGGNITIGGNASVTAQGGSRAAGIGGASGGAGGSVTITGAASVTATGGNAAFTYGGGAGIGSGGTDAAAPLAAGTITIDTTGTVSATGGNDNPVAGGGGAGANIGEGGYGNHGDGAGLSSLTPASNASATVGGSATFTCSATLAAGGGILDWDWTLSGSAGSFSSANPLTVSPVTAAMSGNQYRCEAYVTGVGAGSHISYYSHPATLTVAGATTATAVPTLNPATLAALVLALLGLAGLGWKRRVYSISISER
ncbi:MAG: hypothetical protein LBI48_03205 [Burkholderiaceae bacterium]|jgi:hypothetical protein|nr:hypothetical protein [Burkholderiaceae bacterium]